MPADASTKDDPIIGERERHREALRRADLPTLVSSFRDDAIFMPSNETTLCGHADIRKWYEEYFRYFRIETLVETERSVTLMDEWAFERYAYAIALVPVNGGDRIWDDGRFLSVWRRGADNDWKMAQAIFNSIRPIGSGTSKFIARMSGQREKE